MDAELEGKINQVAAMLGQTEVPDNIKDIISMFASKSAGQSDETDHDTTADNESSSYTAPPSAKEAHSESSGNEMQENLAMIMKMRQLMDQNKDPDPKLALLSALEPFLSTSRQEKLQNCKKIFQMTKLTSLFKDIDIFK